MRVGRPTKRSLRCPSFLAPRISGSIPPLNLRHDMERGPIPFVSLIDTGRLEQRNLRAVASGDDLRRPAGRPAWTRSPLLVVGPRLPEILRRQSQTIGYAPVSKWIRESVVGTRMTGITQRFRRTSLNGRSHRAALLLLLLSTIRGGRYNTTIAPVRPWADLLAGVSPLHGFTSGPSLSPRRWPLLATRSARTPGRGRPFARGPICGMPNARPETGAFEPCNAG